MTEITVDIVGVHANHCCSEHGCKYGDVDCPVMSGAVSGIYCEDCEDDHEELLQRIKYVSANEKREAKKLGDIIGYGRMMQLGQELWRESLEAVGLGGGEFVFGPCESMTVPCGCKSGCDWCEGAGWLTKKVKAIKDIT